MKIALVAPLEESVPPTKYGGTELVVYNLAEELTKLGQQTTVLASGDSKTSAKLEAIFPRAVRKLPQAKDMTNRDAFKYIGAARAVKFLAENKFDIIHNHLGWRLLPFSDLIKSPMVTTLHGPLNIAHQQLVYGQFPQANYISISLSQRQSMPELNFTANVYNGIQIERFDFSPLGGDYLAFLGRMSPEKGPLEAIQIAKQAKEKLIMAAKVDVSDKKFFIKKIKPLINAKQIKFIGEVDHRAKVKLLGQAKALLAPIQWPEPFGLFFIEAMACGTPGLTLNQGSAPEIISDGGTGFVCQTEAEIVDKIKIIKTIDRNTCRRHIEKNFTAKIMAENYLSAYEKIINKKNN